MKSKVAISLIHITAWIVFFSIPLVFFPPVHPDEPESIKLQYRMFLMFLTSNMILISVFYLNYLFLIPRLLFRKKYLLYASILVVLFAVFLLYGAYLFPQPAPRNPLRMHHPFHRPEIMNAIYLFIMVVFISGAVRLVQEWLNVEKKNRTMEAERLQSELNFLHAQINPHFLFNTLNSIYGLALIRSELTADAVMRLSSLMRYILQDVGKEKVALQDEIHSIQNYVELQKMRISKSTVINLVISGEPADFQIPPLILLGFVENAFKYGTSSHEGTTIGIEIEIAGGKLEFKTGNSIFQGREKNESFGIGRHNSERRLQLIYPDRHKFSIVNNGKTYKLHLTIQLI
jgi:two-component system, LytTR family, sensor kinase